MNSFNSVQITNVWRSDYSPQHATYEVTMKELNLKFHLESYFGDVPSAQIFAVYEEGPSEPYIMWKGATAMEGLRFLEDTHPELLGFMSDQTLFANKMWDDIQNAIDWSKVPGIVDAPEGDDLEEWSDQTTSAQMAYIKERIIEKFGSYRIFDYDATNNEGEVK